MPVPTSPQTAAWDQPRAELKHVYFYLGSEQERGLPESAAREGGQARVRAPSWPCRRCTSGAYEEQQWPEGPILPARTDVLLVHTSMTLLDTKVVTVLHTD